MPPYWTWILLAAGLFVDLVALLGRGRRNRRRPRAFVEVHPRYRLFMRRQGLTEARHFLDLSAAVISGHPGRSVARVAFTDDDETIYAFLKRESRVSWLVRLAGATAGFGFVSRSLREARTLEALQREGVGCPEWLAAGEDERGRAFLLVRETPGATELRAWLRCQSDPMERRRLARSLGAALAHMHATGFTHPDLYSKHVLIGPAADGVQFLDWQRSRRRLAVHARRRARDLAALHATLTDDLADARERLLCLGAYCDGFAAGGSRRAFLRLVLHYSRRLLRRRHIREKRQLPLARGVQEWMTLNGGELCITPALAVVWPRRSPQWLALDSQPPPKPEGTRRWLTTDGGPALLIRRRRRLPLTKLSLWGKPRACVEQRHAELLLRLQRHAAPAPQVLAMGRRAAGRNVESFVLIQPAAGAVRLTLWLARQTHRPEALARRRRLLRDAGALLHRLHDAACYLDDADALAVRSSPAEKPLVLLTSVERVKALRRPHARRARRDRAIVERALIAAGCSRSDRLRFLVGYRGLAREDAADAAGTGAWSGYRTTEVRVLREDHAQSVSSPDSLWSRFVAGARRLRQRADWATFAGADWSDCIMDVAVTDRFHSKQGRSTGRWVLYTDGPEARRLSIYLKRHYQLPWWDRLLAALWPGVGRSPAFQEWEHLEWARRVGVPVPKPVAAAEYVGPWGRLRSVLAVEELHDMLPLQETVPLAAAKLAPADFRRWKRGLIAEMARLTRLLHDRCRFHKDLYLCHFYVARADAAVANPMWRGRVFLIDLHRLGRHPWTWLWWRTKDLAQLLYSSEVVGIDPRDRLNFWQMYRGPGPRRTADRWLVRLVLFKWRRYRRHNARQKARAQVRTV
jgi:tRNA A-37 threonylcarbamoyl transferase component Bud32